MRTPPTESAGNTLLHKASPRLKLLLALLLIAGTVLLPRQLNLLYCVPAGVLLLGCIASRLPLGLGFRRMLVAQLFIVSLGLLSLFSPAAWQTFLATFVKSNLCVLTMVLLTWTTPFQSILQELRHAKLPLVMLTTIALMYRYLPVLSDESRRMQRARASRTFGRSRTLAWQTLSVVLGQLFIRSVGRAERIYLAMCARGWK